MSVARRTPLGAPHASRAASESAFHLRPEGFAPTPTLTLTLTPRVSAFRLVGRRLRCSWQCRRWGSTRSHEAFFAVAFVPTRPASAPAPPAPAAAAATTAPFRGFAPLRAFTWGSPSAPRGATAPPSPTSPTAAPSPTTPPPPPAPPALAALFLDRRARGGSRLGPGRLGDRGAARNQLDARLEVRVHLDDTDLGGLGRRDAGAARAAAEPRAARRGGPCWAGRPHRRRGRRRRHRRIVRLVEVARRDRLGGRRAGGGRGRERRGRTLLAELHGVGAVVLLREVDDLGVVRLSQQLGEALRVEWLRRGALELDHGVPQLVSADRLLAAAQPREGLLEETVRLADREPPAPAPSPARCAPGAAVFGPTARSTGPLLAGRFGTEPGGLRRGAGHTGPEPDLVLPVVELGEADESLVRRLDHEPRAAPKPEH